MELNYSFILTVLHPVPANYMAAVFKVLCFKVQQLQEHPLAPFGLRGTFRVKHPAHHTLYPHAHTPDRQINTPGPLAALRSHPLFLSAQYFSDWVLFQSSTLLAMECFSSRFVRAKLPLDWTCSGGGCLCVH